MTDVDGIENILSLLKYDVEDIKKSLIGIDKSLEKIADFFDKWEAFDGDKPELYVSADVATHEA